MLLCKSNYFLTPEYITIGVRLKVLSCEIKVAESVVKPLNIDLFYFTRTLVTIYFSMNPNLSSKSHQTVHVPLIEWNTLLYITDNLSTIYRFLGSLKGLQIQAQATLASGIGSLESIPRLHNMKNEVGSKRRKTNLFISQLMKEQRKTNYSFLYYQRNEDKPKYLFLNYRRKEDEAK